MVEKNKDDTVVVEEDPVVSDGVETPETAISDNGTTIGIVSGNKTILTIIATFIASIIVYKIFFSSGQKEDIVETGVVVTEPTAKGGVNRQVVDHNSVEDVIKDVAKEQQEFNYEIPDIENTNIKIPELPSLTNDFKNTLENEIAKENGEYFSKDEVDELINERLKIFEDQMLSMKAENNKLIEQMKKKEQESKTNTEKALKEKEEKNKKDRQLFQETLTKNLFSGQKFDTNGNPILQDETPVDGFSSLAEEKELEKKKEEEVLKIAQKNRVLAERKGVSIFKIQSGGGGGDSNLIDQDSIIVLNKDLLSNVKDNTTSVVPTKTPDLSRVILQGKVIDAVLESAITTDVQAQVRAVITRDIYAEYGKNILIPKGSKVIGTFNTIAGTNVSRLGIVWNRIIRVDGLSLNISANATDSLGRGGVEGDLDNKYMQILRNSFLASMITVATAAAVENVTDGVGLTTTTTTTGSTTTGKASDYAVVEATEDFMKDVGDIVDDLKEEKPTIRIPQGTKVIIMVNQDLSLPIYKTSKK